MTSRRNTLKTAFTTFLAYITPISFTKASNRDILVSVNGHKMTYKKFLSKYATVVDKDRLCVYITFSHDAPIKVSGTTKYVWLRSQVPHTLIDILNTSDSVKVIEAK